MGPIAALLPDFIARDPLPYAFLFLIVFGFTTPLCEELAVAFVGATLKASVTSFIVAAVAAFTALLITCVFNSGCATGKHGVSAIEVEGGKISLVHWAREGKTRPYLLEEALSKDGIEGSDVSRYILKQADLDYVFARIDLLGKG